MESSAISQGGTSLSTSPLQEEEMLEGKTRLLKGMYQKESLLYEDFESCSYSKICSKDHKERIGLLNVVEKHQGFLLQSNDKSLTNQSQNKCWP